MRDISCCVTYLPSYSYKVLRLCNRVLTQELTKMFMLCVTIYGMDGCSTCIFDVLIEPFFCLFVITHAMTSKYCWVSDVFELDI